MQKEEIKKIKEEIKDRIKTGDFVMLSEMRGKPQNTTRSRYLRNKEEEVKAMLQIVLNREQFISNYKQVNNIK